MSPKSSFCAISAAYVAADDTSRERVAEQVIATHRRAPKCQQSAARSPLAARAPGR